MTRWFWLGTIIIGAGGGVLSRYPLNELEFEIEALCCPCVITDIELAAGRPPEWCVGLE